MGVSKSEHFSSSHNDLANLMKALAHPARIAIIEHLLRVKKCICSDLVNELPLAQPTISQHLKELKQVNLIQGSIEGNSICYCINPKAFEILKTYFTDITQQANHTTCC